MAKDVTELTNADWDAQWESNKRERDYMALRQNYYDGRQAILGKNEKYSDNTSKSEIVTNWTAYTVNRYAGSFTQYQVTSDIELDIDNGAESVAANQAILDQSNTGLAFYGELSRRENIPSIDIENRRQALINGKSVELHSFDAESASITIDYFNPIHWVFLQGDDDVLLAAMYQVVFGPGDVLDNQVLGEDESVTIRRVYTASEIINSHQNMTQENGKQTSGDWEEDSRQNHEYAQVPVIVWKVDADMRGIISDAIIAQNDEYNSIDSSSGDSVRIDVDSLLVLKGIDANDINENIDLIRNKRILTLPAEDGVDAEYLNRKFDNERTELRLSRTRKNILMMGEVPDVNEIVGASGSTSGIALKLMFTPMEERAMSMTPFLIEGMNKRIELINTIQKIRGDSEILNPTITIQFRIPVNRIEEWKNIGALDGIVSHKTQLKLLTDVQDPEKELETLVQEAEALEALDRLKEPKIGEEAALIEKRTREITELGDIVIAGLEPTIATLSDRITDAISSAATRANSGGNENE